MEEKLKAPDDHSGDSEVRLFQQCQELQALLQEKEGIIAQLEQQLEEQVRHTHTKSVHRCGTRCGVGFFFTHRESMKVCVSSTETKSTSGCQNGGGESSQDQGMGDAEVVRGKYYDYVALKETKWKP